MKPRWALQLTLACAGLLVLPTGVSAQGTWMQTHCLAVAGSPGPCKAAPAWGQTGLDHVQALAAAAGPGNLGQSLAKPETLPAGNAARAQVAAVMLGFLDSDRSTGTYRWFGPVATPATPRPAPQATAAAAPAAAATGSSPAATAASSPAPAVNVQAAWHAGAVQEEPQSRSASWWLAGVYAGPSAPLEPGWAADRYRVLRFLADHCPQLEGKVAPNAWTRCTTRNVSEPGVISLLLLALALAGAACAFNARGLKPQRARGDRLLK